MQDVFEFSAPTAGPTVAVSILMHGDETCGLAVLKAASDQKFALLRGRLRIIVMNRAAYESARGPARHLGNDMNRCWSGRALMEDADEARRIEAVLPFLSEADAILDIHSMPAQDTPFLLVSETRPRSVALAAKLGAVVPRVVVALPPNLRGTALFETSLLPQDKPIVVVECGQHEAVHSPELALATFLRFLSIHGMVAPPDALRETSVEFYQTSCEIKLEQGPLKLARPMLGFDPVNAGETYGWDGSRPLIAEEDCRVLLTRPAKKPGDEALTLVRPIPGDRISMPHLPF